jgi:hypothetical protein
VPTGRSANCAHRYGRFLKHLRLTMGRGLPKPRPPMTAAQGTGVHALVQVARTPKLPAGQSRSRPSAKRVNLLPQRQRPFFKARVGARARKTPTPAWRGAKAPGRREAMWEPRAQNQTLETCARFPTLRQKAGETAPVEPVPIIAMCPSINRGGGLARPTCQHVDRVSPRTGGARAGFTWLPMPYRRRRRWSETAPGCPSRRIRASSLPS